jgi:phage terminase large subunit
MFKRFFLLHLSFCLLPTIAFADFFEPTIGYSKNEVFFMVNGVSAFNKTNSNFAGNYLHPKYYLNSNDFSTEESFEDSKLKQEVLKEFGTYDGYAFEVNRSLTSIDFGFSLRYFQVSKDKVFNNPQNPQNIESFIAAGPTISLTPFKNIAFYYAPSLAFAKVKFLDGGDGSKMTYSQSFGVVLRIFSASQTNALTLGIGSTRIAKMNTPNLSIGFFVD